jgi:large subunit ribosomal protein L25
MDQSSIKLAKSLPPLLSRFFKRYPPSLYSAQVLGSAIPANRKAPRDTVAPPPEPELSQPPSSSANLPNASSISPPSSTASPLPSNSPSSESPESTEPPLPTHLRPTLSPLVILPKPKHPPNPFLPYRNPATGRWRGAHIGLRRQADLVKLAVQHGVEPLLPPGTKSTEYKKIAVEEKGKRLKGTGVGERVKGHRWERTLKGRLEARRQAMVQMPELIREWKEVSIPPFTL